MLTLVAVAMLSACGPANIPAGIEDPYEAQNRKAHADNVAFDRTVLRPVSMAYGRTVPGPVRSGIGNVAANLSLPEAVINSLLQLRPGDAVQNTTRFLINSTIGIAGLFDPATAMGAPAVETDFGETLYVWGVPEGSYTIFPLIGPSTGRHAVGRVVDFAFDPLGFLALSQEGRYVAASTGVLSGVNVRYERTETIDSVLYDSADSYAQTRQIYLENRRFKLRRGAAPEYFDPYEDPYDDVPAE
ncbi:VacJ family lipoprotein [Rhodovulum sp. ES.010]|uniref:MlaA family lipoprotein n=1 Tax=Rhodovulum sp. ES.010 TaxID=1882821 RepID=UPI0020CA2182|nr:VacJ family lipoprotein [Rhodovulum sp. ES.010]